MAGSGAVATYGELDERSNRLAHVMRQTGLRTGDHIALMMENIRRYWRWRGLPNGRGFTTRR